MTSETFEDEDTLCELEARIRLLVDGAPDKKLFVVDIDQLRIIVSQQVNVFHVLLDEITIYTYASYYPNPRVIYDLGLIRDVALPILRNYMVLDDLASI